MAAIAEKPFLEYLLLQLKSYGVTNIILCIGYRGEFIEEYFGHGAILGLRLSYSCESEPLSTGGALKLAEPLIKTSDFLVLNGDSFFDIDLRALIRYHQSRKARATIALAEVENTARYGSVEINAQGEITCFLEKAQKGLGLINGGVYMLSGEVLALIPRGRAVSLEREVFPRLIGHGLYGLSFRGYFVDIGVPEDYLKLQAEPGRLLAVVA
jgi:NDP-sugar pyrophosphorylase family protein